MSLASALNESLSAGNNRDIYQDALSEFHRFHTKGKRLSWEMICLIETHRAFVMASSLFRYIFIIMSPASALNESLSA